MANLLFNIFIISFLFINLTVYSKENKDEELANIIYEFTDSNIDYYISQSQYKWFILFYLTTCSNCARAKNIITKHHLNITDFSMRFGQIEIHNNSLSSVRFKAAHVPYIVIIQKGRMYEMTRFAGEKNIIAFINEEKNFEDSLAIPDHISLFGIWADVVKSGMTDILNSIKGFFKKKNIFSNIYIRIAGVILFALFLYFEYWLIYRFYKRDNKTLSQNTDEKPDLKKE